MRIAMLSPGRTHSGHNEPIRQMIELLADGLTARGIEVTLFPSRHGRISPPVQAAESQPWEDRSRNCEAELAHFLDLGEVFDRADDFDLIHNHAGFLPLTYTAVVKRPILTTMHGCTSGLGLPLLRKYDRSSYYVAVGNRHRTHDLRYEATIYYGVDVDSFSFTDRVSEHVLFCGNIHPDSGALEAIEICRLADKSLVIAGKILDERYFAEHIAPLLDGTRVQYVGPAPSDNRNELFGNAMALLHPQSGDKPFDFSILEANACGTPVVAFSHGLVTEIITNGINGFVVPDIAAAAEALKRIATVSRARCREVAEERFSQQRMVAEYLRVYEDILERTRTEDRRPWGYYVVLSDLPDHKVKRIVVWPGKRLSLQSHRLRSEHWTIIAGSPIVTVDGKEISMQIGQSIDIPVGTEHRIYNPGQDPVVFVEVQMGAYFGEDDIVRFEDDFGRF